VVAPEAGTVCVLDHLEAVLVDVGGRPAAVVDPIEDAEPKGLSRSLRVRTLHLKRIMIVWAASRRYAGSQA